MNKLNLILIVFLLVGGVVIAEAIPSGGKIAPVPAPLWATTETSGVPLDFKTKCERANGVFAIRSGRETCIVNNEIIYTSKEQLEADEDFLLKIREATSDLTNAKVTSGGKEYTYPDLDYSTDYKVASTALLDYGLGFFKIAEIATEYYKMKNIKVGRDARKGIVEIKEPKIEFIGDEENENYKISYKIAVNDKTKDYFVNYKIEFMDGSVDDYERDENPFYRAGDDKIDIPIIKTINIENKGMVQELAIKSITIEITSPDKEGLVQEKKFVVRTDKGLPYEINAWLDNKNLDVQFYLNDIWKGYYYQVDVNGKKYPDFKKSGSDLTEGRGAPITIPAENVKGLNSVDVYVYESQDSSAKEIKKISVVIKKREIKEAKERTVNAYYVNENVYVVFEYLDDKWVKYLYGFKIGSEYESEKNTAGSDLLDVPQKIAVKPQPSSVRINYYKAGGYFGTDEYLEYFDVRVEAKDGVDCEWFKTKNGCNEHTDLCEWIPTERTGFIKKGEIWLSNIGDSKAGKCTWKVELVGIKGAGGVGGVGESDTKTMKQICTDYGGMINSAAAQNSIDASLIAAVISVESSGNPLAVSVSGAAGLGQFNYGTGKKYFSNKVKLCCVKEDGERVLEVIENGKKATYATCDNEIKRCKGGLWCEAGNYGCGKDDPRFKPEFAIPAIAKYLSYLKDESKPEKALEQYYGSNSDADNKKYAERVLAVKKEFDEKVGAGCVGGQIQPQTDGTTDLCSKIIKMEICDLSEPCIWEEYDRTIYQTMGDGVNFIGGTILDGLKTSVNGVRSLWSDTPTFDISERADPGGYCVSKYKVAEVKVAQEQAKIDENEYFKVITRIYKEKYLEIEFKLGEKYQNYYFTINIGDKEYQSKRRGSDLMRIPTIITNEEDIASALISGITVLGYENFNDEYTQKEEKISINDVISFNDVPCSQFFGEEVCDRYIEECAWNSDSGVCDIIKLKTSIEEIKPAQLKDGVDYTISANIYQNEYLEIKFNLKKDIMKNIYYSIYLGKKPYKLRLSGDYLSLNPRIIIPKSDFISSDLRPESKGIKIIGYVTPSTAEIVNEGIMQRVLFEKIVEAKRFNRFLCGLYSSRKECVVHTGCEWAVEDGILAGAERIVYINTGVEIPGYCKHKTSYIKGKDYLITAKKTKTTQGKNYVLFTFIFQNGKMKTFKYDVKVGGKDIKEKADSDELEKKTSIIITNEVDIYNAQTKGIEIYGYSRNPATNEEEVVFSDKIFAK